jgi:hypothetical protein
MGADSQVTSARDIFKKARRAGLVVAAAALLALPAAAHAGTPVPPHELLPDLVQEVPQTVQTQADPEQPGHFQVGFTSIVGNVGEGPMEIHGTGPGLGVDMTAHQVVYMSDASPKVELPDQIGVVHFETDPTHDHWHFQPFDDYELRSLDGSQVYADQKEGFCLINSLQVPFSGTRGAQSEYPLGDFCHNGLQNEIEITEGISVGWGDEYTPFRGGQDVDVTGVPAGRYYLVHEVNKDHSIKELGDDFANNSATATVDLTWPNGMSAKPAVKVLATCLAAQTCPYTDPPAPPPPPAPAPDVKAPKLLLGGASRQRFLRGRAIYVYAKCDELCKVTASGRIAAIQVAKSLRTSSTRMTLKPGVRTKIKLRISDRVRKLINKQLKRGARVTVRVSITAIDASGNRTSSKRTLTLLPRSV